MSFSPINYKIVNENKIQLQYYGKLVMEKLGNRINHSNIKMSEGIYLDFTTPIAKHNERFVAKFDREVEGIRIYNVTDSYLL